MADSSRRNSMKTIAVASFGSMTLRDVVAAAAAQRQRPLTNEEFNRHFAAIRGSAQFRKEVSDAKTDLSNFLTKNFYLTPQQIQNVKALPAANLRVLNQALDSAATENLTLKLEGRPFFSPGTLTLKILPAVTR